jgi:hypothetical protein
VTISPEPSPADQNESFAEVRLEYGGSSYSGFIVDRRVRRGAQEALVVFFCLLDDDPAPRRVSLWFPYEQLTPVE